jgi:hypothetical protein
MTGPPSLVASTSKPPKVDGSQIGSHLRFDVSGVPMSEKAREKIAARNVVESSDEDEDDGGGLDVIDDSQETFVKSKAPSPASRPLTAEPTTGKRKRPVMDPFAGYFAGPDPISQSRSQSQASPSPSTPAKPSKKTKSNPSTPLAGTPLALHPDSEADSEANSSRVEGEGGKKKKDKKEKRARLKKEKKLSRAAELAAGGAGSRRSVSVSETASGTGTPADSEVED